MLTVPWLTTDAPTPDRALITAWRTRGRSTRVIAPTVEPVTLAFAKAHGKIPDGASDQVIDLRIRAAREWVERYTGRGLMAQTLDWTITDGDVTHAGPILLPVAPVISVTSVTSYTAAGSGTVMSNALYFLDNTSAPARLLLNDGAAWPSGLRQHNSLVVRYLAGYGTDGTKADDVPAAIRQAILLLASEWNERLEATSGGDAAGTSGILYELPFGVKALLDPYVVYP